MYRPSSPLRAELSALYGPSCPLRAELSTGRVVHGPSCPGIVGAMSAMHVDSRGITRADQGPAAINVYVQYAFPHKRQFAISRN